MGIVCQKLRDSAKGQECTFAIPGICNHDPETVVLCHAPSEGVGNKGHDYHAAFGCSSCHEALDRREIHFDDATFYWLRAMMRTQNYWFFKGLIELPVDPETAKRRPKKKANLKSAPMTGTKKSGWRKPMRRPAERRQSGD